MAGVDIIRNFRGTTGERRTAQRSSQKGSGEGREGQREQGRKEGRSGSRSNEVHVILDDIGSEFCLSVRLICLPHEGVKRKPKGGFSDKSRYFKPEFEGERGVVKTPNE